jgi:sialate O-acetylesterase
MKDVIASGPRFRNAKREGGTVRLEFDMADGLHAKGDENRCFAIAGEDQKFEWCPARIEVLSVVLQTPRTDGPLFIRYAWADNPACNLFNSENLPAAPFEVRVG